jgi:transcriptional regulator with XRE-family HTH domain
MMAFALLLSEDIALELASRVRSRRLAQSLTQEGLASRSGVPFGTLKKFERTGQIAFVSFIRLVTALGDEAALENLLPEQKFETLDEVLDVKKKPKRGTIK